MTEQKKHPYAHVLRWLAAGESVQWENDRNRWIDKCPGEVLLLLVRENTSDNFRIKPKTIRIGKYEVAEPMKEVPSQGTEYFWLDPRSDLGVDNYNWHDDAMDKEMLARGCIWLNKEDAELAAKAIKELLTGQ